jgi:RNA polymerase sigma-70 factor (ECF subfamily)
MAEIKVPYQKLADEELMVLVGKKDSKAFEVLYDRYSRLMYNYFHRMLWKDKEKSRDFTQDLFSKLIHKPELFNAERSFKTWLYSVAHNMCKNEYAKHEVRQTSFQTESGASQIMDRKSFNEELEKALQELDEVKRTTFELRFKQELSIQEISEIMECSEGTVKSRLFYTLKQLNTRLKIYEGMLGLFITLMIGLS